MENYFQKHSNYINELKSEIDRLQQEIRQKELSVHANPSVYKKKSDSIAQYAALTKQILDQKGINNIISLRFCLYLSRFAALLPLKLMLMGGGKINYLYNESGFREFLYIRAYEFQYHLLKIRQTLKPSNKKICKIAVFIPTLQALAGAERYTLSLTHALRNITRNSQIDIISTNIFSDHASLYDIPTTEEIKSKLGIDLGDINFRYIPLDYKSAEGIWRENNHKIATISAEYDLFINCQQNLYPSKAAKSIFVCHFPHRPLENLQITFSSQYKRHLKYMFCRSYDLYISNSNYTKHWLLKYWNKINSRKISILAPPVLPLKERTSLFSKKKNIIMTCGRIDPEKKLLEMAMIFHHHKKEFGDYEFHIAGTLYENEPSFMQYFKKLEQIAVQNKSIVLHPNISFSELILLYKTAKIYWHGMGYQEDLETNPIKTEHFGISIVEAMTYGCVPVVHNSGGQAQIVGNAGLNTAWQTEKEAVSIIKNLIQNKNELKTQAKRAIEKSRQYAEEEFINNLITEIYNSGTINKRFFK